MLNGRLLCHEIEPELESHCTSGSTHLYDRAPTRLEVSSFASFATIMIRPGPRPATHYRKPSQESLSLILGGTTGQNPDIQAGARHGPSPGESTTASDNSVEAFSSTPRRGGGNDKKYCHLLHVGHDAQKQQACRRTNVHQKDRGVLGRLPMRCCSEAELTTFQTNITLFKKKRNRIIIELAGIQTRD